MDMIDSAIDMIDTHKATFRTRSVVGETRSSPLSAAFNQFTRTKLMEEGNPTKSQGGVFTPYSCPERSF